MRHVLHSYEDNNPLHILKESSYYDSEKLNLLLKYKRNCFGITSTNIQSINAKFSELEAFVFELQSIKLNFSVICLQESWLYEPEDTSLIELDGYNRIAQGKSCSTKGGIIMYINKNLKYKVTKYDVPQEHWEGHVA